MAYNYGKTFTKDGKQMRYRYTDKKKATKKLVPAAKPRASRAKNSKR
jgi:hypothetical protein